MCKTLENEKFAITHAEHAELVRPSSPCISGDVISCHDGLQCGNCLWFEKMTKEEQHKYIA